MIRSRSSHSVDGGRRNKLLGHDISAEGCRGAMCVSVCGGGGRGRTGWGGIIERGSRERSAARWALTSYASRVSRIAPWGGQPRCLYPLIDSCSTQTWNKAHSESTDTEPLTEKHAGNITHPHPPTHMQGDSGLASVTERTWIVTWWRGVHEWLGRKRGGDWREQTISWAAQR